MERLSAYARPTVGPMPRACCLRPGPGAVARALV